MFRRLFFAAAATTVLVTFAVAARAAKPQTLPMPLGDAMTVELVLNQQEVGVDVSQTNAMAAGGGLLGALIVAGIDNSRTKSAEERIVPVRDLLLSYPFNARIEQEIRADLPSPGIDANPNILVQGSALAAIDAQNKGQLASRALVLTPRYAFDNQFHHLSVKITAQVIERDIKPNGKVRARFAFNRTYAFQYTLPEIADKPEDNVKAWVAFGADGLTSMVDEGLRQSVDMLVFDFSSEGRAQWEQYDRKAVVKVGTRTYPGLTVREGEGWAWARSGKGFLQALSGYRVAGMVRAPMAVTAEVEAAQTPGEAPAVPTAPTTENDR